MPDSIYNKLLPPLKYSGQNILVVGDLMLDSYWQGLIERISPEAPVPIVHVEDKTMRIGGAGNVAVNISSLGARVSLMSVIGRDEAAQHLADLLEKTEVTNHCIQQEDVATTIKLRVLSQHQQLIRLDFESTQHAVQYAEVSASYTSLLNDADIVVLSDYGKGMLADASSFIQYANAKDIKVLVDPKHKDFSRYQGAYLITPNKKEFEAAIGLFHSQEDLEQKAREAIEQYELGGMLVTQGEKGMTLVLKNEQAVHFPARAQEVFDVTGAGDTVIASLAAGLSAGLSVQDAVHLSSIAAAIVVGRVGTASVTLDEVLAAEHGSGSINLSSKIISQQDLEKVVKQARVQHKKIVMTNGCFDLMHSGHVRYLEQAARLGDILIVAVNSDASVQKLKGMDRPINALEDRMTVLAALASVSIVVAFEEETPEQLICRIKPDILVKGSDYQKHQIAGAQCAGEVHLVNLVDGKSTSSMVEKIQHIK
jgi:D-beta-D-heptose 7-phosphate kinase / D-beta-D-heptose 1-phosphate adenosyltransferase